MTDTIALSDITRGDHFRMDDGPVIVFESIEHNETTPEARIYFRDLEDPRHSRRALIADVADVAFYAA